MLHVKFAKHGSGRRGILEGRRWRNEKNLKRKLRGSGGTASSEHAEP